MTVIRTETPRRRAMDAEYIYGRHGLALRLEGDVVPCDLRRPRLSVAWSEQIILGIGGTAFSLGHHVQSASPRVSKDYVSHVRQVGWADVGKPEARLGEDEEGSLTAWRDVCLALKRCGAPR